MSSESASSESSPPASDLHRRLAAGLSKVSLVLRHQLQRVSQENELTPLQTQILVLLLRRPLGLRVGQIADELAVTAATTSNAISTLVRKKLARKTKGDPNEHRATTTLLTAAGERLARELELWPDVLAPAIDSLAPAEQTKLLESLTSLIRVFEERNQISPARMCASCEFFQPNRGAAGAAKPHYCHFIDAPIGRSDLQVDCPDHEPAPAARRDANWDALQSASPN